MGRMSGKWLGIGIAVLVVGALAFYASASGSHSSAASATATLSAPLDQPAPTVQTVSGMSAGELAGLVVKVGIVAALLGASLWLLRRYAGTGTRTGGRTGAVSIADTIPLAQGRALYVLDVGDRALVVGATPQQLSLLAEVTDAGLLEKLRAVPERQASAFGGLAGRLNTLVQSVGAAQAVKNRAGRWPASFETEQPPATAAPSFAETFAGSEAPAASPARYVTEEPPEPADATDRLAALAARLRAMRGPA